MVVVLVVLEEREHRSALVAVVAVVVLAPRGRLAVRELTVRETRGVASLAPPPMPVVVVVVQVGLVAALPLATLVVLVVSAQTSISPARRLGMPVVVVGLVVLPLLVVVLTL